MNRDFNEADYETLSQLDNANNRGTSEKIARIVN